MKKIKGFFANLGTTETLLTVAVLVALARFLMPSQPLSITGSYSALSHLFIGGLIGAWLASRQRFYFLLMLGLCFIEIVAFSMKHRW